MRTKKFLIAVNNMERSQQAPCSAGYSTALIVALVGSVLDSPLFVLLVTVAVGIVFIVACLLGGWLQKRQCRNTRGAILARPAARTISKSGETKHGLSR